MGRSSFTGNSESLSHLWYDKPKCGRCFYVLSKLCKTDRGHNQKQDMSVLWIRAVQAGIEYAKRKSKENRNRGFSEEEILALGLYPKDEAYKMSLISRILGKR